ncbi:MAG: glycosyltransferase [Thermoanaerobaculia bacterium]
MAVEALRQSHPRTALVHDWLTGMRGGEKVLELFAEALPAAPIYTLFHFPGTLSPALEARDIRTSYLQRPARMVTNYRYLLPLFPRAIESLDLSEFDLVVSISTCVAKGAVRPPGGVHICYCNTPMRYVWDQRKAYFPNERGPLGRLRKRLLDRLQRWDVDTALRVDHFVGNSSFVAERIRRYYDRGARVIHPPVDTEFFEPEQEVGDDGYALVVSALAPYKRIEIAIAACARAGVPLKIVGTGPERSRLDAITNGRVEFLGWRSADELRRLYQRASCVLQPGVEDFGIAPVEALACGTPVVALARGGVLDIVENGRHGVLYEEAGDPEALAAAIDKCRELRFNFLDLRKRSVRFSTQRFRDEFSALLAETDPRRDERS